MRGEGGGDYSPLHGSHARLQKHTGTPTTLLNYGPQNLNKNKATC